MLCLFPFLFRVAVGHYAAPCVDAVATCPKMDATQVHYRFNATVGLGKSYEPSVAETLVPFRILDKL
jgi:hypothetical protein